MKYSYPNESKYVVDFLTKIDMLGCKPAESLTEKCIKGVGPTIDKERNQWLVEIVMYLFHTRPHIS